MSDPTVPSLPPPPPSSSGVPSPPPPFSPAPQFGYSPLPMDAPPPTPPKSRTALWIGLGVVAALGVAAAIWAGTSSSDSESGTVIVATSVALPSEGEERGGLSGWAMTISPEWENLDFGEAAVEGGWTTGGGDATFRSNVNVLVEFPEVDPSLAVYMEVSEANIGNQLEGAVVISSEVFEVEGREFGRIEYTASLSGIDGHFVGYVIKTDVGRFVVATFTTLDTLFAAEAPQVEPWLATLREK